MLAFVPMRSGSKGILDKNTCLINGRPLFYYVLKTLEDCEGLINRIVVSTDSKIYKNIVKEYFPNPQIEVIYRSKEASLDTASTEECVLEFLEETKNLDEKENEDIILCQLTSPLLTKKDVLTAVEQYEIQEADSMFSCVDLSKRFLWKGSNSVNYDYKERKRRQDLPVLYDSEKYSVENGCFYIFKKDLFLKYRRRLFCKVIPYYMPEETFFEIDSKKDFKLVEQILKMKEGKK